MVNYQCRERVEAGMSNAPKRTGKQLVADVTAEIRDGACASFTEAEFEERLAPLGRAANKWFEYAILSWVAVAVASILGVLAIQQRFPAVTHPLEHGVSAAAWAMFLVLARAAWRRTVPDYDAASAMLAGVQRCVLRARRETSDSLRRESEARLAGAGEEFPVRWNFTPKVFEATHKSARGGDEVCVNASDTDGEIRLHIFFTSTNENIMRKVGHKLRVTVSDHVDTPIAAKDVASKAE